MAEFNQNSMWPPTQLCATHSQQIVAPKLLEFDLPLPVFDDDSDEENNLFLSEDSDDYTQAKENSGQITRISPETLVKILDGDINYSYDRLIICDCRYPYEYHGGHIVGAKNITRYKQLLDLYNKYRDQNTCVVFHCEFSQNRGPTWAHLFRNLDRNEHLSDYPKLSFPNVFILDGGYKRFFQRFGSTNYCGEYTPMDDEQNTDKTLMKRAKSLFEFEIRSHLGLKTPPVPRRAHSISFDYFPLAQPIIFNSQPNN